MTCCIKIPRMTARWVCGVGLVAVLGPLMVSGCSSGSSTATRSSGLGLAGSAWPRFGGSAGNAGLGTGHGAVGKVKWKFNAASTVYGQAVIGPDGTVYILCAGGEVYALDHTNGREKWRASTMNLSLIQRTMKGSSYLRSRLRQPNWQANQISSAPAIGANGLV
jgi:outer membrane protein assembly factor BamB